MAWKVKKDHNYSSAWKPPRIKQNPELCIKQEPEEFPFHVVTVKTEDEEDTITVKTEDKEDMVTVKTEDDEDNPSGLHQRPTEEKSSSDTDDSEDYSQQQAPAKRSYAMIPPDSVMGFTPFSCSDCGKIFASNSSLRKHSQAVHAGHRSHKCSVCEETFSLNEDLKTHMKIHKRFISKPFPCSVCDKGFVKKTHLPRHLRLIHHICPVCSVRCANRNSLKEHLRTHVEEGTLHQSSAVFREIVRPFICTVCGQSFACSSSLQSHKSVHSEQGPHKCSVCEKSFTEEGDLETHMKIHTGDKPLICSLCDKVFVIKSDLCWHQTSLHHTCPVCIKHCTDRNSLNEHLRIHIEEGTLDQSSSIIKEIVKSFSCSDSGESFACNSDVLRRRSLHSGKGPHKYSVFGKTFAENGYRKIQMKFHTEQNPLVCSVCETSFELKSNLDDHMMTHVSDQPVLVLSSQMPIQSGPYAVQMHQADLNQIKPNYIK